MSDAHRTALQQFLVVNYGSLSRRLARRLGASDAADEALQDRYPRLESASVLSSVRNPISYLFNIATDRRRSEARRLTAVEVDTLLDIADDTPDPAQVIEARSELLVLEHALLEMPKHRRTIFKAVLIEKTPRSELARRFSVSERTIDTEVQFALEHGTRHLQEFRQGNPRPVPSEALTDN